MGLLAAYFRSLGLCMTGENSLALKEVALMEAKATTGQPPWIVQSTAVMLADIHYLAGDYRRANEIASEGFRDAGSHKPLGHGYTGIVARWLERTCSDAEDCGRALGIIDKLCDVIAEHDLLDQAEILCARRKLGRKIGRERAKCNEQLAEVLAHLPLTVEEQLRRLGSMD